jgi:hypothetical protein
MVNRSSQFALSQLSLAGPVNSSFYASRFNTFLTADANSIVGQLSSRHVGFHASAEADQIRAWECEIVLLRAAIVEMGQTCHDWWLLIEVPLLRLGKRMDAVVLAPGVIAVIEFKTGRMAHAYEGVDRQQTEYYAQCLRDFHEASQSRLIVPILCAERAPAHGLAVSVADSVAGLLLTNAQSLAGALALVAAHVRTDAPPLDALGFDTSPYRPTPTIVEAAQALYAGHKIGDIGRGDAADGEMQAAANALRSLVARCEAERLKVVCFVTGAPGAGKTLLGLDLALKGWTGTQPSTLLSGNRPLVHVLTEALAEDNVLRTGQTKANAKHEAIAAIQNLLGYLKQHTDGAAPPEHIIVFDEAQRAWDKDVGEELMGRPSSEPELFLKILDRKDWSCLVCLVGPGQEINRGEGGLRLWGEALADAAAAGRHWRIVAPPQALEGGPDFTGEGILSNASGSALTVEREPRLHLANSIRAYRNPLQGRWVAALLEGDINAAKRLAERMRDPPAWLTRDLGEAKNWLRLRRRGGRSVGLLTSSGAVRLLGEGLPLPPRSNELKQIGHWFLKPYTDFRSAGALELPLSEFGCQGLELDYVGMCWGGDLIWNMDEWTPRTMRAPRWQVIRESEKRRFRLNGYRVLLTRGRAGVVIFVPRGSADDPTRRPQEADAIADALQRAGCADVEAFSGTGADGQTAMPAE